MKARVRGGSVRDHLSQQDSFGIRIETEPECEDGIERVEYDTAAM